MTKKGGLSSTVLENDGASYSTVERFIIPKWLGQTKLVSTVGLEWHLAKIPHMAPFHTMTSIQYRCFDARIHTD
jgi:hypothetical protein